MIERPAPVDTVVSEDLDEDVCLYRCDIDEVLVLNRTAADVWRLIDGEFTVTDIVQTLVTAYDTTEEGIRGDVEALVEQLHERGYVVERLSAPAG